MQHIKPSKLDELPSRLTYVQSFLAFTPADGESISASGPLIRPLIPIILDAIYSKLLSYDITAQAFVPKTDNDPEHTTAPTLPQDLDLSHPHIKRQMSFLRGYVLRIVANKDWTPDSELWSYMDKVAIMHTGAPGFKHRVKRPELRVEYMHLALLLGFLEDVVIGAVMGMDLELETKTKVVRAWSKLLWTQNDLFARHYTFNLGSEEGTSSSQRVEASHL